MRSRLQRGDTGQDALTDVLFNALLGFVFMFVVAFSQIDETESDGKVDPKAEVLITVRWPDGHPDDVDVVVEDPRGEIVWYQNQDAGLLYLDRDDRGTLLDTFEIDGERVSNPLNQESVSVRNLLPGEYVVNLLHYKADTSLPVPVTVKIEDLNPQVSVVYYGEHELRRTGDEVTAVRFRVREGGAIGELTSAPKQLLSRALRTKAAGAE